jgi:hypothetical protein
VGLVLCLSGVRNYIIVVLKLDSKELLMPTLSIEMLYSKPKPSLGNKLKLYEKRSLCQMIGLPVAIR